MKHIFPLLLSFALLLLLLCSCGGTDTPAGHVTRLSADAAQIKAAVSADAQFANATFLADTDEDADLALIFNYGIEDDAQLAVISDYVVSTINSNDSPCYFAAVRFSDGTDRTVIDAVGKTMTDSYSAYVVDQMVKYNGEKAALAESYTLYTYDNAVVLFVYDGEADTVLSLLDGLCK